VWDLIRRLHADGRTVILTTHSMEEAEALCSRVAIIHHGRLVACDTPAALIGRIGVRPVLRAALDVPLERVTPLPGVHAARYSGTNLEVETAEPQATLVALQALAAEHRRPLSDIIIRQPNLEDVFLQLTGQSLG
jgi:ABC-2 type transport system ATP-binding protein